MDFFDKLNTLAKTATEKTTDFVEDTKLKTQILNDKKSIRELEQKIGAYYYQQYESGEPIDEAVREFCTAIAVHKANIAEKEHAMVNTASEETQSGSDLFEA